jgi:hypothetical protein
MAPPAYPNLGFDPCPGDVNGYRALADYAGRSASTLAEAERTLASAGSAQWRGQAANAFRDHVHADVLPLAQRASNSVSRAANALRSFATTLEQLQQEAARLNAAAGPWHDQRAAALTAAKLPATASAPYPSSVPAAQRTQLQEADTQLTSITTRANDIQTQYNAAVQTTAGQLDAAGNMAPHPPGLFSSLWHDVESGWDDFVHMASEFVHDKALLQFISGVANLIASVAGILALFPPLTAIFGPIALAAAVVALAADALLAIFDHGSWVAVGLDLVAVVSDTAWMKAAGKLTEMYKVAGAEKFMAKATTYSGLISKIPFVTKLPKVGTVIADAEHTVPVAPGMFRFMGESLKDTFLGGDGAAMKAFEAIDGIKSGPWRALDIQAGMINWTAAGVAITQVPSVVHTWLDDFATGKQPWQVPAG